MTQTRRLLRRYSPGLALLAVVLPLGILLALQYRTLTRLRDVSEVARRGTLGNYLEAVTSEVRYFYLSLAARTLNVPGVLLKDHRIDEVAHAWRRMPLDGIRRLFLVDMTAEVGGRLYLYDADSGGLVEPGDPVEKDAITGALNRWAVDSGREDRGELRSLRVFESAPGWRLMVQPIRGDSNQVLGLAGLVVDEDYCKYKLLPAAIESALPGYFPDVSRNDLLIRVRDSNNNILIGTRRTRVAGEPLRRDFPLVFTDWAMEIQSGDAPAARLAQANFRLILTLSLLLAAVLVAGIALALRAADRSMRLSEMKSDFVSNVSHELRTPLASIRLYAELLRLGRTGSVEKARAYGAAIEAESRRLGDLIENVLDFSRIESGRKAYRMAPGDLAVVVATAVEGFRLRLLDSGIELIYEPPAGPLPPVVMDDNAVALALNNLMDNAVKYSGDSRRVEVRLVRRGGEAEVAVLDRGIGIPESEQKKIFERFHRVGTGLVHDVKGSGLGLAIVHHIMKAHHGQVTVESAPGRGSTFRLHLPLAVGTGQTGAALEMVTARSAPVSEPDSGVGPG